MFTHYGINFDDKGTPIKDTTLNPWLKKYFTEFNAPNGYIASGLENGYFRNIDVCNDFGFFTHTGNTANAVMLKVFNNDEDKWEKDFHYAVVPKMNTQSYKKYTEVINKPFYLIKDRNMYQGV